MKYCTNCGVELDPSMDKCPLCQKPASESNNNAAFHQTDTSIHPKNNNTVTSRDEPFIETKQRQKLFWELTVLISLSVTIITLVIDLFTSHQLTWSKYPISISIALLIYSSFYCFLRHKPVIFTGGSFASISALLLLIDYIGEGNGWSLKLGIPLLVLLYLFGLYLFLLIKYLREKGINIIALLLLAACAVCLGVESILDYFSYGTIAMGWSIYVLVSTLPIVGILFFVHYRMKKGRELKRLFHL